MTQLRSGYEMLQEAYETNYTLKAERDELTAENERLQSMLAKIHVIVNKPRFMSQFLSEADLWRSVVTEVQEALTTQRASEHSAHERVSE